MRYRSIGEDACGEFIRDYLADRRTEKPAGVCQGTGSRSVDWEMIRTASACMTQIMRAARGKALDQAEGRCAIKLHEALHHVEAEVLDDPGFWRYLALHYFLEMIELRWPKAFIGPKPSVATYIDARKPTESVLTRMYLRATALGINPVPAQTGTKASPLRADTTELAHVIPAGSDFWRSHIIRVRTRTAPPLVRALVRRQRDERLSTKLLREFARDAVNRTWTNVVLTEYDDEEAAELLDELALIVGDQAGDAAGDPSDRTTT